AVRALRVRDDGERESRLARRLGAVDLDDAPARHATHAEGRVEADRTGRDDVDRDVRDFLAELHDRALAELLLDLLQGEFERLVLFLVRRAAGNHVCVSFAGASGSFAGCEPRARPVAAGGAAGVRSPRILHIWAVASKGYFHPLGAGSRHPRRPRGYASKRSGPARRVAPGRARDRDVSITG